MATARHPILYELLPWRTYRWPIAAGAVCAFAASAMLLAAYPANAWEPNLVGLAGVIMLAAFIYIWSQMRWSYLAVDPRGTFTLRAGLRQAVNVTADEVVRVRVIRLSSVYRTEEPKGFLPLKQKWSETPAVAVRLTTSALADHGFSSRMDLRYFHATEIVAPVEDPDAVVREFEAAFGERVVAPAPEPRRRDGGSRRARGKRGRA